jgi:thiol-disulfide isomerase/thioredoxin
MITHPFISKLARAVRAAAFSVLVLSTAASAAEIKPTGTVKNFEVSAQPKPAPDFIWREAGGSDVSLMAYAGKTVLINFWATWCAPCITELPSLLRLQEKLGAASIVVITLNIDRGAEGADKARAMLKRLKLDGLAFHHDSQSQAYRTLGIEVMPTTIVFDAHGREAGRLRGPAEWDEPEAVKLLQALGETPKR